MIYEFDCPTSFLRAVYSSRRSLNPRYSLRSFAAKLSISPGALHKILERKKRLSPDRALKVGLKLGLPPSEIEYFSLLCQRDGAKSSQMHEFLTTKIRALNPNSTAPTRHELEADQFHLISNSIYFSILQLIKGIAPPKGGWTLAAIARRLGTPRIELGDPLERLNRLGLLQKRKDGTWIRTAAPLLMSSETVRPDFQSFYLSLLPRLEASITGSQPKDRPIGAETIAIDADSLPRLHQLTRRYLDEVSQLAAPSHKATRLYQVFACAYRIDIEPKPTHHSETPRR